MSKQVIINHLGYVQASAAPTLSPRKLSIWMCLRQRKRIPLMGGRLRHVLRINKDSRIKAVDERAGTYAIMHSKQTQKILENYNYAN